MHFEIFEEVIDNTTCDPPLTNWSWRLVDNYGTEVAQCVHWFLTPDSAREHLKKIMDRLRLYRKVVIVPLSSNS